MAITQVPNSLLTQPVNHNLLINPSFTVKQRGDVIDHNVGSYGPDRWAFIGLSTVGGTISQSSTAIDSTTGVNKLVVKHRNATAHAHTYQNIETINLLGLYGKEMTFSFSYSDEGGSGIPKVRVKSYDPSYTSKALFEATPTSLGDNRWTCTFTLSTNDGTIPDLKERGLQVLIYPNEKNPAPNEWSLWETKLEVGSVATPFIARTYGEEMALCQRYYQEIYCSPRASTTAGPGNSPSVLITYMTQMRAYPDGTLVIASDFGSTPAVGNFKQASCYAIAGVNGTIDWSGTIQLDAEL
jgi:hypothetical protein